MRGFITTCFKVFGKIPVESDLSIIHVMIGTNTEELSLRKCVGIQSNTQLLDAALLISL